MNNRESVDTIRSTFSYDQLKWLIGLRWCAFAGQVLVILAAQYWARVHAPWATIWCISSVTVASNLALEYYSDKNRTRGFSLSMVAWILILDTVVLTLLLGVSGGPANPFSIIYLAHVSIAALLLGPGWTWLMVGFCSLSFSVLFKYNIPIAELSMHHHDGSRAFALHLAGMLLAFVSIAAILGFFLSRMARLLQKQQDEIVSLLQITASQERLASLTTLAAGAAHELSTPLGTISIAAAELKRSTSHLSNPDVQEDADLILSQVDRCRKIIDSLSEHSGDIKGESFAKVPLSAVQDQLKREVESRGMNTVQIDVFPDGDVEVPLRSLVNAIMNLVKNGVDASNDQSIVRVRSGKVSERIAFSVTDTGHGITPENLSKVGEPFFTTKTPGQGMGLGIFLVKLFARRLGGSIFFQTNEVPGTTVTLEIPQRQVAL